MMRSIIVALTLTLALAGCSSAPKSKADKADQDRMKNISIDPPGYKAPKKPKKAVVTTAGTNTTATVNAPPQARVLPFNAKVAMVNSDLRFIIIDFMNSRAPRLEQRLSVYRVGQKVGEVKVSGPYRNTTVAADLVAGEAKYGDDVLAE